MGDKMEGMVSWWPHDQVPTCLSLPITLIASLSVQQADKFKSRMHSLAYGEAMAAAARDYKKVHCHCASPMDGRSSVNQHFS